MNKEWPAVNPHGASAQCATCHLSGNASGESLRFGLDVTKLCESCHDGRRAQCEAHPVDVIPSDAMTQRMGQDFPLEKGKLTCSTCHDVRLQCKADRPRTWLQQNFLRGDEPSSPVEFCFRCHERQDHRRFNVHDQLEGGQLKTDTCIWCHTRVPVVQSESQQDTSPDLRRDCEQICGNCHPVAQGHPNSGATHMGAVPSQAMLIYMSAYELQPRMKLSLQQLLDYVRAARRPPRSIPLDQDGRITCSSCHNPHEKGLFPSWSLRSVGSEPKHAANHRLRTRKGRVCTACHQK